MPFVSQRPKLKLPISEVNELTKIKRPVPMGCLLNHRIEVNPSCIIK